MHKNEDDKGKLWGEMHAEMHWGERDGGGGCEREKGTRRKEGRREM